MLCVGRIPLAQAGGVPAVLSLFRFVLSVLVKTLQPKQTAPATVARAAAPPPVPLPHGSGHAHARDYGVHGSGAKDGKAPRGQARPRGGERQCCRDRPHLGRHAREVVRVGAARAVHRRTHAPVHAGPGPPLPGPPLHAHSKTEEKLNNTKLNKHLPGQRPACACKAKPGLKRSPNRANTKRLTEQK